MDLATNPDTPGGAFFACTHAHPVTVSALSPTRFRSWVHATVTDIGRTGAHLRMLGDGRLEPGRRVTFTVTIPFVGSAEVSASIVATRSAAVEITWVEPPATFLAALAEYLLLCHPELTPTRLRAAGLPVRAAADRAVHYAVGAVADVPEILDLRLRAHRSEGRLLDLTAADLASPFDIDARHLVCRHGGRIVGCVRLLFLDGDPARSKYVSWGGHRVPWWMWRDGFVEAGAGAVDPEFQRAGLFLPLMQHAVRVVAASGHRHKLVELLVDRVDDHDARVGRQFGQCRTVGHIRRIEQPGRVPRCRHAGRRDPQGVGERVGRDRVPGHLEHRVLRKIESASRR